MLGTIRKNKSEVPSYFVKQRHANSSLFAFDDNKVLVSYAPLPHQNRIVLFLSTIGNLYNSDVDVETKKPAVVFYYNHTKGGANEFDKFCFTYTTSQKTNRRRLRFVCGILDAAGINSTILLTLNMRESEETPNLRRKFLLELGHQLIEPHLKQRYNNLNTRRGLKETIRGILEIDEEPPNPSTSSTSPRMSSSSKGSLQENLSTRCYICLKENVNDIKSVPATYVTVHFASNIKPSDARIVQE